MNKTYSTKQWLALLGNTDFSEEELIAAYARRSERDVAIDAMYWPVIIQRFDTELWRASVAQWVTQNFVSENNGRGVLDDQQTRLLEYLPAIKKLHTYIKPLDFSDENTFANALNVSVRLLSTSTTAYPNDWHYSAIVFDESSNYDILGDILGLLHNDPIAITYYPSETLFKIFKLAQDDPRTAPGTAAEEYLARAAFFAGSRGGIGSALVSGSGGAIMDAILEAQDLYPELESNRFCRFYVLNWFIYSNRADIDEDAKDTFIDIADIIAKYSEKSDLVLMMRLAECIEHPYVPDRLDDFSAGILNWLKFSQADKELSITKDPLSLWKLLRPDWEDHFPVWEALGLEGADWINAGVLLDSKPVLANNVNLPDSFGTT